MLTKLFLQVLIYGTEKVFTGWLNKAETYLQDVSIDEREKAQRTLIMFIKLLHVALQQETHDSVILAHNQDKTQEAVEFIALKKCMYTFRSNYSDT